MTHVLFYRRIKRFTGGHLIIWDYYNHVRSSPRYRASVRFARNTVWDEGNPWAPIRAEATASRFARPDIRFLGGFDWTLLPPWRRGRPNVPVINLIQHVRHADPDNPLYRFLSLPAVRICVSQPVEDAIVATDRVRGQVFTIPASIDLALLPSGGDPATRPDDVVIIATKKPELGRELAERLDPRLKVNLVDAQIPRPEFLAAIARARVAACLPNVTEGFFLPSLEAMGMRTLVVCPDAVGNLPHCKPGATALVPDFTVEAMATATETAVAMPPADAEAMLDAAVEMTHAHDIGRERTAFLEILDRVPEIWSEMKAAGETRA
jgi:hypothetical protein